MQNPSKSPLFLVLDTSTRNFHWPSGSNNDDILHKHPDLDDELEDSYLPPSGLGWDRTPVFVGSDLQDQKYLGELKFCCRVQTFAGSELCTSCILSCFNVECGEKLREQDPGPGHV